MEGGSEKEGKGAEEWLFVGDRGERGRKILGFLPCGLSGYLLLRPLGKCSKGKREEKRRLGGKSGRDWKSTQKRTALMHRSLLSRIRKFRYKLRGLTGGKGGGGGTGGSGGVWFLG